MLAFFSVHLYTLFTIFRFHLTLLPMNAVSSTKITVLVAVYNTEQYLPQCLDSLCNQTLNDIQIVCIDDCSTDSSANILQQYAQRDSRIVVMKTPHNSGQAVARNLGLTQACGQYTTMLDSDDWYAPDTLQLAYEALQQNKEFDCALLQVVMHDDTNGNEYTYALRTKKEVLTGEEAFELSTNNWGIHGLYVLRTDLHKQMPYDTTCRLYSDDNTTHLHYLHAQKVVVCKGRYYYRQHAASTTNACSYRHFDLLEANLSMRRQLEAEAQNGRFSNVKMVMQHIETLRWCNLIGMYGYFMQHGSRFTMNEQREALQRMRNALHSLCFDDIDARIKRKPGYWPLRNFALFRLQSWVYFKLRWLIHEKRT